MKNNKSIVVRTVFTVALTFFLIGLLFASSYFASNSIYNLYLKQPGDKITQWKFITAQNTENLNRENVIWKYSNAVFGVNKPLVDRYIRLQTALSKEVPDAILIVVTQSKLTKVLLDGKDLQWTTSGNNFTRTTSNIITLPANYAGKELEITANTSLFFEIKAGITQEALFRSRDNTIYQMKIAFGLVLAFFGFIAFFIAMLMAIKLRGLGRVILSGILLIGTGAIIILSEISPFSISTSDIIGYKLQFILLMSLTWLIFAITLYTSKNKGIFPKVVLVLLALPVFPYIFIQQELALNYFMQGYAIMVALFTLIFLFLVKGLLVENVFKKKLLYLAFFSTGICITYDFFNVSFGISPALAGFFLYAFLLYFFAIANLTISEAIYLNVRINERNQQISRNTRWIERIVAASASIFVKQRLEEFAIQTAVSIKGLIMDDLLENAQASRGELSVDIQEPSVSIAIKKNHVFSEIYNQGDITNCKYELLEQKYSGIKKDGVFFGGSYMVVLLYSSQDLAAIIYFEGIHHGISENLKNIIMIAYGNISIAMDNLKLKSDIIETQQSVFIYLAEMSEAKSEETGSHIKRVSGYTRAIAESLNLNPHEVDIIAKAAMMHDVGKLAIPEELIKKKSNLSPGEYEIVKQHVVFGYNMLAKSQGEFMEAATVIAQQHHEKWNGEGYLGLKGEQIHLYARITAVADVFDALMSKRSYKEAWTVEQACGFILEKSGTQFDPRVTAAFMNAIDKIIQIRNENPD